MPQSDVPDTNVYDMRLTKHDDGYIYGVFCTERKDPSAPEGDTSSAVAAAGIARTKNLDEWERLPDLISTTGQQRNVVLFPHLINGKYAFSHAHKMVIDAGSGGSRFWTFRQHYKGHSKRRNMLTPDLSHYLRAEERAGPCSIRTDKG